MSKIEVDAIDKQSGSTLTLGGSGTAVTLACGATQTGFGRTGTVDWQTGSIKTATFTAVSGEGYFCNTAGGTFEVDLPAGSAGAIVSIQDYNNTFDSNALTVDPNGSEKINGGDAGVSITLDTEGRGVTFVYIDATVGWRSVQDNDFTKKGVTAAYITATGGTITTVCTNFKVHTFTGPGTFTVCSVGNAAGSNSVDYLVLAGGGGGSGAPDNGSGGGGAGGFRTSASTYSGPPLAVACGVPVTAQGYAVVVGGGGAGGVSPPASNGTPGVTSSALSISSAGGGGGSKYNNAGQNGGSGGGAGEFGGPAGAGGTGNQPPVSPAQGKDGGGSHPGGRGTGGGGGATEDGVTGTSSASGRGGAGAPNAITGSAVNYAGGGGGGIYCGTTGAASPCGTGGAGKPVPAGSSNPGTVNRGGGGGGSGGQGGGINVAGGAGGSGIVIIRYKFQN